VTGGECFLNVLLKESRKKTKRGCKELENESKKQKFPNKVWSFTAKQLQPISWQKKTK